MKRTANTTISGFGRIFQYKDVSFSTLTTNSVQITASNSTHGPNKTIDMVEVGSGSCI